MMNARIMLLLVAVSLPCALPAVDIRAVALFKDQAMLAIDGKQRLIKVGEVSPEGVTLVRADSHEAVIRFKGAEHTLKVGGGRITGTFTERDAGRVRLYPDARGHYLTPGRINGVPVSFLVDTGATYISMEVAQARRIGLDYTRGERAATRTAAGTIPVYVILLNRVEVGGVEKHNVRAVVSPDSGLDTILLGNSFLNLFNLRREADYLELVEK